MGNANRIQVEWSCGGHSALSATRNMLAALLLVSTASSFGQRGADEFSTVVVRKHLHILEQVLTGSLNEEAGRCKKAKHAGCRLDELLPCLLYTSPSPRDAE